MPSVFLDKAKAPTRASLERALGRSATHLRAVEEALRAVGGEDAATPAWKFYGRSAGWSLAYRLRKRTLLHLIPEAGSFTVVFILGARAVESAGASDLPAAIRSELDAATRHVEGTGIRIPVRTKRDVDVVHTLLAIKLAN